MRVLVTGAAGSIGRSVTPGLTDLGHQVRGLDRVPLDRPGWITGDCGDPEVADAAVRGVDAVVHLAGNPDDAPLAEELDSHVRTTEVLLDAMIRHGVRRIAYASSNHAVGRTPRTASLTVEHRPRPDSNYGIAKVAAEALLALYCDCHDLTAIAMRIGTFEPEPSTRRALSTWLSPGDAVRLVDAAIRADATGFAVVYGISANTDGWWDLEPGRRIGYEPRDDAARYADRIPARAEDETEAAYVGGAWAAYPKEKP